MRSGIRKLVRTSASFTAVDAARGKPWTRIPTSVLVPPTSTTMAFSIPARNAAPRIEFVGPDDMASTG